MITAVATLFTLATLLSKAFDDSLISERNADVTPLPATCACATQLEAPAAGKPYGRELLGRVRNGSNELIDAIWRYKPFSGRGIQLASATGRTAGEDYGPLSCRIPARGAAMQLGRTIDVERPRFDAN